MSSILDRIREYKEIEVEGLDRGRTLQDLESYARNAPQVRGFQRALESASKNGFGLIGEIKKASPSKGLIRKDFDSSALARAYEAGGAACLSVLTDRPSFQGEKWYLTQAATAVNLPLLRKDFVIDPRQVIESRALRADCILLIMAMLSDSQAREIESTAQEWRMDVLVEVHDRHELERAFKLESRLIGINNRDLNTFEVSLDVTIQLSKLIREDWLIVAESGLSSRAELDKLSLAGVRCFLIGESLMRQPDVKAATRALLQEPVATQVVS